MVKTKRSEIYILIDDISHRNIETLFTYGHYYLILHNCLIKFERHFIVEIKEMTFCRVGI